MHFYIGLTSKLGDYTMIGVQAIASLLPVRAIGREVLSSMLIRLIYIVTQLLTAVILARYLGASGFGLYSITVSAAMLIAVPVQLGLPHYMLRRFAILSAEKKWSELRHALRRCTQLIAVAALLAFVVVIALLGSGCIRVVNGQTFYLALSLALVLSLLATYSSSLRAIGGVVSSQVYDLILRPGLLLILAVVLGTSASWGAAEVLIANILATSISALMSYLVLKSRLSGEDPNPQAGETSCELLRASAPFLWLAALQMASYQADVILLGILAGAEDVGFYRVALQLSDGVGAFLIAITAVVGPHIVRLHHAGDMAALRDLLVKCHLFACLIVAPALIFALLLGEPFLEVVFGQEFRAAYLPLTILLAGKLLYASVCFSGVTLSLLGMAKRAVKLTMVSTILSVVFNAIFIHSFGAIGAAIASSLSLLTLAVLCAREVRIRFGMQISAFAFGRQSA